MRGLVGILTVVAGLAASQVKVDQGAPGNQGAWNFNATQGTPGTTPWLVNQTAQDGGTTTEVFVGAYTDGGCNLVPPTPLAGRRSVEIQNNGAVSIWCTLASTCPVVGGARSIPTTTAWAIDVSDATVFRCITTTTQVDGGTTVVTEIR